MAKKIINPTNSEVYIKIQDNEYRVSAKSSVVIENDSDAEAWRKIHGFLSLENISSQATKNTEVVEDSFIIEESVTIEAPIISEEVSVSEDIVETKVENKKKKSK